MILQCEYLSWTIPKRMVAGGSQVSFTGEGYREAMHGECTDLCGPTKPHSIVGVCFLFQSAQFKQPSHISNTFPSHGSDFFPWVFLAAKRVNSGACSTHCHPQINLPSSHRKRKV